MNEPNLVSSRIKNKIGVAVVFMVIAIILSTFFGNSESGDTNMQISPKIEIINYKAQIAYDFNYGYEWAEDKHILNFDECDYEFANSTDSADGCNQYVQEQSYFDLDNTSFYGYKCTEDCSGHKAGYEWAEMNRIISSWDCGGNSSSFIEGCIAYTEEYR
ncbi:MAG: hypothetical protein ACKKL4_02755 [Patescibacteria group bacterium]